MKNVRLPCGTVAVWIGASREVFWYTDVDIEQVIKGLING